MQKDNTAGFIGSASFASEDAADAREDAGVSRTLSSVKVGEAVEPKKKEIQPLNPVCRICGKPSERKRRRDRSWFYYDRCRECRRQTFGGKSRPASIRDGRLIYLLEILQEHLVKMKATGWESAPKGLVVKRIKSLIGIVME